MSRPAPVRRAVLLAAALCLLASIAPFPGSARTVTTIAAAAAVPSVAVRLRAGAPASSLRVPAEVRWSNLSTEPGVRYRLQRRDDGGAWREISLPNPAADRVAVTLDAWRVHDFRVAVVDASNRTGPWILAPRVRARQAIQTETGASYYGTWQRTIAAPWLEGATRWTRDPAAIVRFSVRAVGIAWVASKGPDRGQATVTVDGGPTATVDLRSSVVRHRRVVWARTWASLDRHEVTIDVVGSGLIDLDGLLVLEEPTRHPVLAGAGDIARCSTNGDEATARLLDAMPEATVFTAGDNAYWDGTAKEFAQCYGPSWGRHLARTRPAPGNHEYHTPGAAGYKAYFGKLATPSGKTWYAYDLGAWRIYVLDSECSAIGGCGPTSAQGRWLTTDLARHPRRCVAAIWHAPRFSSGAHGSSPVMRWAWQTFDAAGAEVVVSGHEHDYERFSRQHADGSASTAGMRQFVVGTGGVTLRPFGSIVRNSVVRWSGSHGILALTLHPAGYSWRFTAVSGSTFRDAGTTACA